MKILAFVDSHGKKEPIDVIRKKSKEVDIIISAGDLTVFEDNLVKHLSDLNDIGKPVLIIHGNHEDEDSMKKACSLFKNITYLHKGMLSIENYLFFGYGGGGFSVLDKGFEKVAVDFEKSMKKKSSQLLNSNAGKEKKGQKKQKLKTILILHGPPYKTKVDYINSDHVGSKSYRKFIDANKPTLVVCGHLHENSGVSHKLGETIIVNPGPLGAIIDL